MDTIGKGPAILSTCVKRWHFFACKGGFLLQDRTKFGTAGLFRQTEHAFASLSVSLSLSLSLSLFCFPFFVNPDSSVAIGRQQRAKQPDQMAFRKGSLSEACAAKIAILLCVIAYSTPTSNAHPVQNGEANIPMHLTDKTGRGGGYLYMLGGGCEERQNGQRRCEKTQE